MLTAESAAPSAAPAGLPKLVPGISSWPFFPEKLAADGSVVSEGVSIVGSRELDRYVTVPNRKLPAIEKLLRAVAQGGSREEAEARLRREGLQADVEEFCARLRTAGLVLGDDGTPVPPDSDLERNFVRVGSASLRWAAPLFEWAGRHLVWILAALIALAAVFLLRGGHVDLALLAEARHRELSLAGLFKGALVLGVSFFLHELSHGVVAGRFGMPPRKFELGFYLGFLPTFFLRIGGLYTLPPRQRAAVWSAGAAGNLLLASGAAAAMLRSDAATAAFWARVMWINVALGLFNLVPFLPTDGYFIASTLVRRSNIRRKAWASVRSFRSGGAPPPPLFWLYAGGTSAAIVALLAYRLLRIAQELSAHPVSSTVQLALIIFFISIVLIRRRRRADRT